LLKNNGLIELAEGRLPLYKITQKGLIALECLRRIEELIPEWKQEPQTSPIQSNNESMQEAVQS
jgi:hypothetical protein